MKRTTLNAFSILERIRRQKPVVHHITNWVTIYECANVVKVLGASPVMAHAAEEAGDMAGIASAVVLNIGTLTTDLVEAMKIAGKKANARGIPVVLDACGAGATAFRDQKCEELLSACHIDVIKGNASEIARVAGKNVVTKGVDASEVEEDLRHIASVLSEKKACTVAITGETDIVCGGKKIYEVRNGHPLMAAIVGTGCMAASVIGTFAAVEKDLPCAAASGLACFGIAGECAAKKTSRPGTFKEQLFDSLHGLDEGTVKRMQKIFQ